MPKPNETHFENHFCQQLETKGRYKRRYDKDVDDALCLHFGELEEFIDSTQDEKLTRFQEVTGQSWKKEIKKAIKKTLETKRLFELLRDGLTVNSQFHFDLIYFEPDKTTETEQAKRHKKNRFTYVRQYHFVSENVQGNTDNRKSLDIVLLLNGFAIVTIELKNETTSGTYDEAIKQYLKRDLSRPVFQLPFLHIVCDNATAKMAAAFSRPPTKDDFRDFNEGLINVPPNKKEYPVYYLYHQILLPESLLNYIQTFLYTGKTGKWIFPRFHQQRTVRKVYKDIVHNFEKSGQLNLRYLIQHSTGSGKSNTIVWLVQNLRNLHANNERLFDSILVLTDRISLDGQISKDFIQAIDTTGVVAYTDDKIGQKITLKEALEQNYKVIVSTIHKFSHLKDIPDQTGKKICIIIDEGHRSQSGLLHQNLTNQFDAEQTAPDPQEKLVDYFSRKAYPNLTFIALSGTPTDKMLQQFGTNKGGKKNVPFDVYSMDEAIKEGYILDVVRHLVSYETLYQLSYKNKKDKEYNPLQIIKALKQKAFDDDEIIKEKCQIIASIFKEQTLDKINGYAKAMIAASSRLGAVKYKLFLDEALKKQRINCQTLVAFTGPVRYDGKDYTEKSMNATVLKKRKLPEAFEKDGTIRFLIVANKYQTGFDEPLLHTLFLDKSLSGKSAVQTLSRLNRKAPNKTDTLTVDFTNSYEKIITAFRKFQHTVISNKEASPQDLVDIKNELLKKAIFTLEDINEFMELFRSERPEDVAPIAGLMASIKRIFEEKVKDAAERDYFRSRLGRYISIFGFINTLYRIDDQTLRDFYPFAVILRKKLSVDLSTSDLAEEIAKVKVTNYSIDQVDIGIVEEPDPEDEDGGGTGGGGGNNSTPVRMLATVEEVVEVINLRFHERFSNEGAEVVEGYVNEIAINQVLKATIRSNMNKDMDEVYNRIIKDEMLKLFAGYIIKTNPKTYQELMDEQVKAFVNKTAYRMLNEMVRGESRAS
ncbi:MAG: DEAD/DEAH box helicase family protein [Saprospiraceae bacterium]